MPVCPKGHTSTATDYCDECGAPIGGSAPVSSPPPSPVESTVESPGEACPECATPRDGRFCEVCGHDYLAEPSAASSSSPPPPPLPAPPPSTVDTWRVVATADRVYYDRMRAEAEPDAEPVAFPLYCPERRFALAGTEVLIGRRSRSRGIEPGVDLTGPPEDAGISHVHALLVATPDGWSLVDLDSANGTYLNDGADQVAANQPVPLTAGDRIHLGAWTTLTIQPG
jgi:hypothetical protein